MATHSSHLYLALYFSYLFTLIFLADGFDYEEANIRTVTLDEQDKYQMSWVVANDGKDIIFSLDVKTQGWVGLGFSPTGGMTGADIIVGWVDSEGKGFITDRHAKSNTFPEADVQDDLKLLEASESEGKTKLTFLRKLVSCDKSGEDWKITKDTTRVIYAYGSTDPVNNQFSAVDYHGRTKGVKSIYLLDPVSTHQNIPEDVTDYEFRVDEYEVPEEPTTYYCSFYKPPQLNGKHHVISYEPVITPGNEGLVHHILVYACTGITQEHMRNANATEGICFTAEMPEFEQSCRTVIFSWAVGGEKFYYPKEAGVALGSDDGFSPEYFMMETHYDNPDRLTGLRDSSGIRISMTPSLRKYDVGTLDMGLIEGIFVPPRANIFNVTGYCHSTCTEQWIPKEGINIFGYLLHAHVMGRAIQIEWYRDEVNMGVLAQDQSYDFNYQENRLLPSLMKLLPGDSLKITCSLSSLDREEVTYGGLPSTDEMCLGFLHYYPKQNVSHCSNYPGYAIEEASLLYRNLDTIAIKHPYPYNTTLNYKKTLNKIDWSDRKVKGAQEGADKSSQYSVCMEFSNKPYEQFQRFEAYEFPTYSSAEEGAMETEDPCLSSALVPTSHTLIALSVFSLVVAKVAI